MALFGAFSNASEVANTFVEVEPRHPNKKLRVQWKTSSVRTAHADSQGVSRVAPCDALGHILRVTSGGLTKILFRVDFPFES